MSWLTNLLVGWLSRSGADEKRGWFTNQARSFVNSYTQGELTGAAREANAFSSEEAQKQRDWEEEMSNTAYQRQVKDMQNSGLNPALMYGGSGSSGASTPSGSSASSVSPSGHDISSFLSSIMDAALLKSQIENIEADTKEKEAGARERSAGAERTEMLSPLEAQKLVQDVSESNARISRIEAENSVDFANVALLQSDAKVRDEFNRLNLELEKANLAKSEAEKANILQSTENLKRDFALSFAREAEIKAQTGLLSQQTTNALVENGILRWNEKNAQYESSLTEYNYNHADGDRVWNRVATGASIFRDAGIGIGAVVGGALKGVAKGAAETTKRTLSKIYGSDGRVISETTLKN